MYKSVPLYDVKLERWEKKDFPTQSSYVDWLWSLWKEPGQYDFDDTVYLFNEQAKNFNKRGVFCLHPTNSKDFVTYWEDQKDKCRNGAIYKNGDKEWFLPREYYMLLNFLKIYNKEKKDFTFIDVRDVQYHMALYEELAEHSGKHVAILKKRQMLSSYYHAAKLINRFWFDSGSICKLAASLGTYVKDTWRFIDGYRNFLNQHTAWYRPCNPDKALDWQQKIEIKQNGKKMDVGLKSVMKGLILDKDPSASVGGPCHRKGTKILMASGEFKNVENIKIGEFVLGIDNKPKKVIREFSGIDMIYEVNQLRGESYYTTGDHKLYLINRDVNVTPENKLRIIKTKDWNSLTPYHKKVYVGVKNKKPLIFNNNYEEVTLDPYFLGLWIGNGFRERPGIIINKTKDSELLEYLEQLSEITNTKLSIKRKEKNRYNDEMYKANFAISENGEDTYITKQFIKYNLFYNKHIPKEYLYGSVETRLAVLAGYIDTDGYYDPDKGHFEISCKNNKLFEQIVFLCRSLGAYVNTYKSSSKEHIVNDKIIKYTKTNRASIRFTNSAIIPTKIKRKQGNSKRERDIHTSPISSIKEIGIESYYGIEVEDNLYYLHDLTITHNCTIFFYDEAGIAPKMNQTLEFLLPALKSGMSYTGLYIAAGSVGDLSDCEPLEELIRRPNSKDVLAVRTNLLDDKGTIGECGLFIPEQWSMLPYVDEYGNSKVEEAVAAILEEREKWKKELTPADYQLRISQKPLNINEAFAAREESPFPLHLISQQIERIKNNTYYLEHVELDRDIEGKIIIKPSRKLPISEFPVRMNAENKEGVIVMHERPVEGAKFGTYYASLDPISSGKTSSSNSLASIYIYKNATEVTIIKEDGKIEHRLEKGKIVCWWTGRFDDLKMTHQRIEMMLELYNAWCVIENNVSQFIQYMQERNKQRYLVPKDQLVFLKDIKANTNVYQDYGWRNVNRLFKDTLLPYGIEFLLEPLDIETKPDGEITKTYYGIERIPDIMLLKEMQSYKDSSGNYDRLIAYCALTALIAVQTANKGNNKERRYETKNLDKSKNNSNLIISPFKSIGNKGSNLSRKGIQRSAFKKLR